MKKVLLVYLPFCTPATPPYSITNIYSFLKKNSSSKVDVLDLNAKFHNLKFKKYKKYYQDKKWDDYDDVTDNYIEDTSKTYSKNNKLIIEGKKPEYFDELLSEITKLKPDIVAFSIVYSSQAFFAYSMLKELKDVTTVIGGPAVNDKLRELANYAQNNELELLELIKGKKVDHKELDFDYAPDFSAYDLSMYFTPEPIIPIKTSNTCYYQKCAFCTHYTGCKYYEFPIDWIEKVIVQSKQKNFFLIDDMIHVSRLREIAKIMKKNNAKWTCQLKPTKDFTYDVLKELYDSGLKMIMWGIESGNDRILKLMKKGTNRKDIDFVLNNSKKAGIKNIAYMMYGFPSETEEEFIDTIEFLKSNKDNIDLISGSIFGLHQGTDIYKHPEKYSISKIHEQKRTVLEPKITYEVSSGLTSKEATKLRNKYKHVIERLNKYPKKMNFFREHMLSLI
jgi:radical SAM superfamily enzyme YgiQ (UPF0313 family)